jgi:iron complex transport system ATP-binding protein
VIWAEGVVAGYGEVSVLDGVDLAVRDGEVLGLIGPNGSGKTTLLRTLYGSIRPAGGRVELDGVPVGDHRPGALARRVAVVTQELSPELTLSVREMVMLGRSPHQSFLRGYTRKDFTLAAAALRRMGARHLAERQFATLSGGEKQRVLVARSVCQEADHLLLDEPTNHLDIHYQHEILRLVVEAGLTTVIVLHDLNLAARYCDSLVLLDAGKVVGAGPAETVLVPEVLEPVYRVGVERLWRGGHVQLLFTPQDAVDPATATRNSGRSAS